MENIREVIIIGSGPAGLTAAIYTARANLNPLVIAGVTFGGQLMQTTEVENFPGFPEGIMGPDLMQNFIKQAKRFGAEMVYRDATEVELGGEIKKVWVGEQEYQARSIIIATGAEPKKLGLESEDKYWGKGVSSCATCDGAFYRDKVVAVVGGGDSAVEEATFLTRFASKVYMIVRRGELRASKIMQDRALNHEKIEIIWNVEVEEVLGDGDVVTGLKLKGDGAKDREELPLSGMFLGIGHIPNIELVADTITQDEMGYLQVEKGTYSNIDGVFIAGDVNDHHYRQAITAAGMGCQAAIDTERWLEGQE